MSEVLFRPCENCEPSIKSHGYIGPDIGPCQKRCSGPLKIVGEANKRPIIMSLLSVACACAWSYTISSP